MKKICVVDQVEFEAKRADAKFCSEGCRKKAARNAGVDPGTGEIIEPTPGVKITKEKNGASIKVEKPTYDREYHLAQFQKMGIAQVDWITTGIPELDAFQMIPRGRITQIQGPFAVGKTTLVLNMIRGLKDKKVFYIDSEASLNPELMLELELDSNNFHVYNETAYIEDMYDEAIKAVKSGEYDLVIIDSLAACTSKNEEEGKSTDRNIGQKALVVNKLMRIIPMMCKNTDTALVIINQEREFIGGYVPKKYTPGGDGPLYHASLILRLKTIPSWRFPKDAKDGMYKGHEIEVEIKKSKVSKPHRRAKIKLYYPESVDPPIVDTPPMQEGEF